MAETVFSLIREDPRLLLWPWMALMSLLLFLVMGADKRLAKQQRRRVPEARLFFLAALGGATGGLLGMLVFRHKTLHASFRWGFSLLCLAQLALAVYLTR